MTRYSSGSVASDEAKCSISHHLSKTVYTETIGPLLPVKPRELAAAQKMGHTVSEQVLSFHGLSWEGITSGMENLGMTHF